MLNNANYVKYKPFCIINQSFLYCNKKYTELLHKKHQTFQIFAFRMIDIYRVISRLAELVKNAHIPFGFGSSTENS